MLIPYYIFPIFFNIRSWYWSSRSVDVNVRSKKGYGSWADIIYSWKVTWWPELSSHANTKKFYHYNTVLHTKGVARFWKNTQSLNFKLVVQPSTNHHGIKTVCQLGLSLICQHNFENNRPWKHFWNNGHNFGIKRWLLSCCISGKWI